MFALPAGASWPLPLYELALLTAVHLADAGASVALTLVTPEERPLQLFGGAASEAVAELLESHGITLLTETTAARGRGPVAPGRSRTRRSRPTASSRSRGSKARGSKACPTTRTASCRPTAHGLVRGLDDVYAAGDLTDFPVKQGGIATQQADAAAESIAAAAGLRSTRSRSLPCSAGCS